MFNNSISPLTEPVQYKSEWCKTLEHLTDVRNALATVYNRYKSKGITDAARKGFTLTQFEKVEASLDVLESSPHAEILLAIGKHLRCSGVVKISSFKCCMEVNGVHHWFALNQKQSNEQ